MLIHAHTNPISPRTAPHAPVATNSLESATSQETTNVFGVDRFVATPRSKAATHGVSTAGAKAVSTTPEQEVVALTQAMVRIDSTSANRVAGENAVVAVAEAYAKEAGLEVQHVDTVNGRQLLIVTLPGTKPELGTVGFVQHSDVVDIEGQWKLGGPFSGDIATDEMGREVLVGRGTIDTKGPSAQVLVAMKQLKQSGRQPDRSMQLFLFPDEETGGTEGAHYLAKHQPELFENVRYWAVEGSGLMSKENLKSVGDIKTDLPYVAMAQKYSTPLQVVLKNPSDPHQALEETMEALDRLDDYIEDREWSFLGDKKETAESFKRFGDVIGGFRGFLLKNFWWSDVVKKRMGPELSATNRTDFAQTDLYLSDNTHGKTESSNSKPSSTTAVLKLDLDADDRMKALEIVKRAAGEGFQVETLDDEGHIKLTLPQESYEGTHHGSIADRERDAINRTNRALDKIRSKLWRRGWSDDMKVVDYYTNKSDHDPMTTHKTPVKAHVTLDLRVAVGEDVAKVVSEIGKVLGDQFEVKELGGPETNDAFVRRLSYQSDLFHAAEEAIHQTYGSETPVLFGNTTASNDVRHLMKVSPLSETLTFVPILNTQHGAHGPDEAITVKSLTQGVEWTTRFMELIGRSNKA